MYALFMYEKALIVLAHFILFVLIGASANTGRRGYILIHNSTAHTSMQ
jgi:hypothetical protein